MDIKALIFATLLILISFPKMYGEIILEEDGFKWEKFQDPQTGWEGVNDCHGNLIIPPIKDASISYSKATYGSSVSVGYFSIKVWSGKDFLYGLSDIKGNIILKPKYFGAGMSVRVCARDTVSYLYTTNLKCDEWTVYDLTGKKLAKINEPFDIDENLNLVAFNTRRPLGKHVESSNGKLESFYVRKASETLETPWGQFFATNKKEKDFEWKLLTLSDGSICGAVDAHNQTLVPVADKLHYIEMKDGIFLGRQEGPKGFAVAYDSIGNTLISLTDSISHLRLAEDYIIGERSNVYFKNPSSILFDKSGSMLIPPGHFSKINIMKCFESEKYNPYIIGYNYTQTPFIVIYDKNLSPIIELTTIKPDNIELHSDALGVYYTFSKDGKCGVLSEKGNVIIPAGKYDLVNRVITDNLGYYEIVNVEDSKNKIFKHGICALNGAELVTPTYEYISISNGKVELRDFDNKVYIYNGDLATDNRNNIVEEDGSYFLCTANGLKLNKIGYTKLVYEEEKFCYNASLGKYQTYVSVTGTEQTPIVNQIFDEAYSLADKTPLEAIRLYNYIIDLDKEVSYKSIKSQCYNNLGVIYSQQREIDKAIVNFKHAINLVPSNQIAANNLDALMYADNNKEVNPEEAQLSGWDIAFNLLGAFTEAFSRVADTSNRNSYESSETVSYNSPSDKTSSTKRKNLVADAHNERMGRNTYNNYVSQLIDMNVFHERYNDSQRKQIQSSMKSIRAKYGFQKSEWEDWNGSPK